MTRIDLVPPRNRLVDQNGLITREWYQFLYSVYVRTGAGDAISNDDIESLLATVDTQSWRSEIDALKNEPPAIYPPVPVDELRALYTEALHQNSTAMALISELQKRVAAAEEMMPFQAAPQIQPVSNAYTPTFTSLTEVGTVNKAGSFFTIGQLVFVSIKVTTSGGGTSEATAGTTYVTLPYTPANAGVAVAANVGTLLGIGTGVVTTDGRLYVPAWAATTDEIAISASYIRAN